MILKIVTKGDGTVVYDNFIKVRYKSLPFDQAEKLDVNAKWLEDIFKNEMCIWITAIRVKPQWCKNFDENDLGLEFTIVASGCVYLCNDEGKTIERIN